MPDAVDVSFELERFEWTADDQLVVVGRWNGVSGRRLLRPALTVDAGGRRTRVTGTAAADDPWRASFDWDAARGEVLGAELELGRSLVVELPPPRRRRRRVAQVTAESDLRAVLAELRSERDALRAELAERPDLSAELAAAEAELAALRDERPEAERLTASRAETERLTSELEAARADADRARADAEELAETVQALERDAAALVAMRGELEALRARADGPDVGDELAGLRLAHGSLKAAHEQLEDELESLRAVREERDALAAQLEPLRARLKDEETQRTALGDLVRELQDRASEAEGARERLTNELAVAREDVTRLQGLLAAREEALTSAEVEADQRLESERSATTEVHERLAHAREEAQRTIVAEAEETDRLRAELERAREDGERLLAAERAEVARLREELLNSEVADGEPDEASRRMLERVERDLDRERAATRTLRRELEALRAQSAEERRPLTNGALGGQDATVPAATAAGRAARPPADAPRRAAAAARAGTAHRVPQSRPSPFAVWTVRVVAALLILAMAATLVFLVQQVMP